MSYISYRLATITASVIFILVILLLILWTGFFGNTTSIAGAFDKDQSAAPIVRQQSNNTDKRHEDERREPLVSDRSVAAPLESNTTDISNEVLRQPIKDASTRQENSDEKFTSGNSKGEILPTDKGDLEYVNLFKVTRNRYEDPPDEYSAHKRHHSGHFRHKSAKVWDPHPQYEFTAFGRHFHLLLSLDSSFVFPGLKITHIRKNTSKWEHASQHLDCFYSGEVDGEPNSIVAVNLCGGMTGHMTTSTGSYLIKPTKHWTDDEDTSTESSLQHAIYRTPSADLTLTNDLPRNHECGVIDYAENNPILSFDDSSKRSVYIEDQHRRRKRRLLWKNTSPDDFEKQDTPIRNQSRYESMGRSKIYPSENDRNWSHQSSVEADFDNYGGWRTRRAISREYFVEVLIVADSMMSEYHGDGLISYILVLMNTVTRIYKDPSIGNPVSIAVVKIINTDEVFFTKKRDADGISASEMLKKFCSWQKRNNPDEPSGEHHDIAVLLTRENLCHNIDNKNCNTLGLAELGRMCSPGSSCAIVQDNGLSAAFTIAHEIGHVFNMPHDDDSRCARFRNMSGKSETYNVMSRMMDDNSYPWEWSKCSRHYITEYLDAGYAQCLLDEPSKAMSKWSINRFPGEVFTGDEQCELIFGTGAKLCSHEPKDVCKRLWCTAPLYDTTEDCHTQHMPWADGTNCGENKWCHRGECVSRQNLRPIDGQWGNWGDYGDCSRTCGGGIKKKFRECNNPSPQNGGNYCIGERVKYKNCGTKECPTETPDFREDQCAAFNNDNLDIRNLPRDVTWHAKYTRILPEDRCKLYCQVESNQYYMLRDKVIDGTPCGPDTFHMCVNGRCLPSGCDHILNSSAKMDSCGVCKGDNSSCQRITGSFNSSFYGYTKVTKIPAGSSFIEIKQHGWEGLHNDSNYLVLRYADREEYILNGKFMVMNRRVIRRPEMTIEYSGPEAIIERLNSSRPIKVDLILEVLSVGKISPPQITYEYTVPKKVLERYTWILSGWSPCTLSCQGMKYRRAECRGTEHKDVVPDGYCRAEKPREESQMCNNHCLFQWQVTSKSECSSHCGNGTRSVTSRCVHILHMSDKSQARQLPDYICSHLERPKEKEPCIGSCHDLRWNYGAWGACSVTCGGGIQRRSANCIDSKGRPVPDEKCSTQEKIVTSVCGQETCPRWDFGEWSPCSATCGLGKQQRPYWCQVENRVVHANYCSGSPSQISKVCDAGPCYKWHSTEWTPCSVSCGEGIRKREVTCRDANNMVMKKANCEFTKQPMETSSCVMHLCPTVQTLPSIISTLKSPLDDPLEHDNDVNHESVPSHKIYKWHSESADEVSRRRHCNIYPCPLWSTGEWSQCDVACGEGYQYRQVRCRSSRGTILPDKECVIKQRPRHLRKCENPPCNPSMDNSFHRWRTSDWSACSTECGEGIQKRNVTCHLVNAYGWLDSTPINECPTIEKPIDQQSCKIKDCDYYWTAGNWKKCSHQCGRKGRQVRRLFCHNKDGKKVPRYNCPIKLKPPRKRKCNQRRCGPTSCMEMQKRFRSTRDGEYNLIIGGRNMSIYCYDMAGREPKEYLTLPAGDRENFAEIYGKRLRNPQTCPFGGKRNESCHCVTDPGTIAGITAFKRVRIDVNKLFIIADDYRFSWTRGSKRVEFGKAGDCYSLANCPQGRFSINLTGTFFKLSPQVSWSTQKSRAFLSINRINDQLIVGKCGGYCGFCAPMSGLKLDILPP